MEPRDQGRRPFPTYILRHPQWKRNLHLNYQERLDAASDCSNPLHRLELFKESMWEVATTLSRETPPEATTTEDKLSWTMIFIRSAETINVGDSRIHANFATIKDHAMELAQQQLTDDLMHLTNSSDDQNSAPFIRRKQ